MARFGVRGEWRSYITELTYPNRTAGPVDTNNTKTFIDIAAGAPPVSTIGSYFGLRGKGMNPSRFGILTLGSDCASSTSSAPMIPLRLRI